MTPEVDVAVVGAGPAGLATAYALARAGRTVRVLESAGEVGGRTRTLRANGCLIDTGAEMIPSSAGYPATWRLITALGLDTDPSAVPRVRDALAVWRGGRARPNAGRPLGLLTGAGLGLHARLDLVRLQARLARLGELDPDHPERVPPSHGHPDRDPLSPDRDPLSPERHSPGPVTIADLMSGYHPDLRDRLVYPLVSGFFGWDPAQSAAAPFAAHLVASGSTATWHTYRDGMDTLSRALAAQLDVVTGHTVTRVTRCAGGVLLESPGGDVVARAAVLAVPAPIAADLHADAPATRRAHLRACRYAPMLRLSLLLDRPMAPRGVRRGFATLIPATEDPLLNVITVDHHKHPGRAPRGYGLISLITSPPGTAELIGEPDEKVVDRLVCAAERFVPGLAARISHTYVHRFPHGLPEASPRALESRAAFEHDPPSEVEYAGDWVALRPCSEGAVASAARAARRVLAHLSPGC
ncbi:FAD-dependent oxidoreductase [Nonomuraea sp. NPDC050404]|uniref:protoporphyrinogen/coproporphyrinogen oxidase n=1 Tax=Nonomuraea sp. NPDC050404 TaxID=3155783 RepID=UPI0033D58D3D